ncbi:hypothetical protein NX801_22315 [Streptomyces sp. LP05-1]|uniref:Uncharacterized protein n=1 Tax=Streptomyces pyxinae TaxID=2970734 RepID=A0ABT2CLN1_9ACTN|nr:hypothetical protein [Streptomyces sp. LP05-1]MCS0638338.1 hypothetical protein [Streptomyces sp. LP05-1]
MSAGVLTYYRCEILVEERIGPGVTLPYEHTATRTISPKLARRWLCGVARRTANRLDPGRSPAWFQPEGRCYATARPDCASQLRAWGEDEGRQREVRERLGAGTPFSFVASDGTHRVTLSVVPRVETVPLPLVSGELAVAAGAFAPGRRQQAVLHVFCTWFAVLALVEALALAVLAAR